MDSKILTVVITLVLGIIFTGSILAPAIEDSISNATEKYNNGPESGTVNYVSYSTDADFDITMTNDGTKWIIGGIDINTGSNGSYIITDNLLVILSPTNGYAIRGLNESQTFIALTPTDWNGVTASVTSLTIDVTPTGITVSDNSSTQTSYTFPNEYVIYSDLDGDRVLVTGKQDVYTDGAKDIISLGVNNNKFFWTTNGADSKGVYQATLLDSSISYTLTEISEDVDKLTVGNAGDYIVNVVYNDNTFNLTPQYTCVPKVITQKTAVSEQMDLMGILPILAIAALIIFAVGSLIISRRD